MTTNEGDVSCIEWLVIQLATKWETHYEAGRFRYRMREYRFIPRLPRAICFAFHSILLFPTLPSLWPLAFAADVVCCCVMLLCAVRLRAVRASLLMFCLLLPLSVAVCCALASVRTCVLARAHARESADAPFAAAVCACCVCWMLRCCLAP